jgi:hypothetical protein
MTDHHYRAAPPSSPQPPEAPEGDRLPGDPRCYFCGGRFRREEDVARTRHSVGNGYVIYVMICPECRGKKERSEPPFNPTPAVGCSGAVLPLLLFVVFVGFSLLTFPGCPGGR